MNSDLDTALAAVTAEVDPNRRMASIDFRWKAASATEA
jgi:hypothetical protein